MNKISAEDKCTIISLSIEKDLRNWIKNEILISNNLKNLVSKSVLENLKFKNESEDEDCVFASIRESY